jgi:hypothetical protein
VVNITPLTFFAGAIISVIWGMTYLFLRTLYRSLEEDEEEKDLIELDREIYESGFE